MKIQASSKTGYLASFSLLVALVVSGCRAPEVHTASRQQVEKARQVLLTEQLRTKQTQQAMTPQQVLRELQAGNTRFVEGQPRVRDVRAMVKGTARDQFPMAIVLSCIDSRQPVELIFDKTIGDIFSARVAGNVLNEDILGSMEFACRVAGARLVAVVGHSNCGAVKGACDDVVLGNITPMVNKIKPAIADVPANVQPRTSNNAEFVDRVASAHVERVVQQVRNQSPILREMERNGEIMIIGGMYDLTTGRVMFDQ
ncbi:MAG: carbonic anhydrase family protein [Limisphaerales bacterium]